MVSEAEKNLDKKEKRDVTGRREDDRRGERRERDSDRDMRDYDRRHDRRDYDRSRSWKTNSQRRDDRRDRRSPDRSPVRENHSSRKEDRSTRDKPREAGSRGIFRKPVDSDEEDFSRERNPPSSVNEGKKKGLLKPAEDEEESSRSASHRHYERYSREGSRSHVPAWKKKEFLKPSDRRRSKSRSRSRSPRHSRQREQSLRDRSRDSSEGNPLKSVLSSNALCICLVSKITGIQYEVSVSVLYTES